MMFDFPLSRELGALLSLAVVVAAVIQMAWQYSIAAESRRWPQVPGKVLKTWVRRSGGEYDSYSPYLEYEYEVNSVRYCSQARCGLSTASRQRAERDIGHYGMGTPVEVWYDPDKPKRATLYTGSTLKPLLGLIALSLVGPILIFAAREDFGHLLSRLGIHF